MIDILSKEVVHSSICTSTKTQALTVHPCSGVRPPTLPALLAAHLTRYSWVRPDSLRLRDLSMLGLCICSHAVQPGLTKA